jgi:RNA-directed DNA polymerase
MFNPIIRGWVNYYGSYYKSRLYRALEPLNSILAKWAMRKYEKLKGHKRRARRGISAIRRGCRICLRTGSWPVS